MADTVIAKFEPNGGPLFVEMIMDGLYRTRYSYDLWSMDNNQPVVLTKTPFRGNNESPHDDTAQIINEFDTGESLSNYDGREVEVSFKIINRGSDDGYRVGVRIKQGNDSQTAEVVAEEWEPAMKDKDGKKIKPKKIGTGKSVGEEIIVIKLQKK